MSGTTLVIVVLLLAALVVTWRWVFRRPGPQKHRPFPPDWRKLLQKNVTYYQRLSKMDQDRFEQQMLNLLDRITITGIETEVEDLDRILIAASGVIPLFGFPGWQYRNLNEVLLYGTSFTRDFRTAGKGRHITGMVGNGPLQRTMILSKPFLRLGFTPQAGRNNVGIHEFVHLLDMSDGTTDGIPEILLERQYTLPWIKLMHEEIEEIKNNDSNINPYGATNQAEFLSVVSEYFFNRPHHLERHHPDLYELLEKMYRQDPAGD